MRCGTANAQVLAATSLLDALEQPFTLGPDEETTVTVRASIGVAVGDGINAADLLRDADIAMYREGETLIHTLVQLGKALSIETFAEGIEEQQELSLLRDEDCDSGQGFLFARPLDAAGAREFFSSWDETATRQASISASDA